MEEKSVLDQMMTLGDVARVLQVSVKTVTRYISFWALPTMRVGRTVRVRVIDFIDWQKLHCDCESRLSRNGLYRENE